MSRSSIWSGIEPDRHLTLIDSALDENDAEHQTLRQAIDRGLAEVRTDMQVGFAKCEQRDNSMRTLLVSLLVSIVLASIGIVATVLIAGAGQ